ncbi:MAG: hypothetical protein H7145_05615 [Akkermansiaceae bacterium]|nr:hypothetical protein [Armatimonadota bacterium]
MDETSPAVVGPVFRVTVPVTEKAAYDAVAEYLAHRTQHMELVIHQKPEFGLWIYYYQSAKYLRTHDISWALAGNGPILLDVTTGEAFLTGTAEPPAHYIAAYIRSRASKNGAVLGTDTMLGK